MTTTISMDSDAAVGTAIRAEIELIPQYGQVVVRLDAEQRRAVIDAQLTQIVDRDIMPRARVDELRSLLAGQGDDPGSAGCERGGHAVEVSPAPKVALRSSVRASA